MPQTGTESSTPPFRDRGRRLALFGVLALLAGIASILLGFLHLALPSLTRHLPQAETVPTDARTLAMGLWLYVMIGLVLVVAGSGSIRCERWVRPIMLVIGWSWLIAGFMALLMVWSMLDDLLVLVTAEAGTLPAAVAGIFKAAVLGGTAIVGILVPLAFVLVYQDSDVARTCEARHPEPGWSDHCPLPVLGLSGGLVLAAALTLPMVLLPVVPFFGTLATGWPGAFSIVVAAAVTFWIAHGLYRVQTWSWWGATIFLIGVGISATMTFSRVPPVEFYRALNYPEHQLEQIARAEQALRWSMVGSSIFLTALTGVYMMRIRRFFADQT